MGIVGFLVLSSVSLMGAKLLRFATLDQIFNQIICTVPMYAKDTMSVVNVNFEYHHNT